MTERVKAPAQMRAAKKIAILDDDVVVLKLAARLLREAGFEVATYSENTDRLNFIIGQQPDLVLLDVDMPFLPGDQLFNLMQQDDRLRRIPVVFLSSLGEERLRQVVTETGAHGYLLKSELDLNFAVKIGRILDRLGAGRDDSR